MALLVLLSRARTSDAKSNAELHMISTILLQFITYFNYNREDWREEYCMHHIVVQWSTIMASSLANSANASGDIFFATQSDSTLQQRGMSQNEWFSAIECNRLWLWWPPLIGMYYSTDKFICKTKYYQGWPPLERSDGRYSAIDCNWLWRWWRYTTQSIALHCNWLQYIHIAMSCDCDGTTLQ